MRKKAFIAYLLIILICLSGCDHGGETSPTSDDLPSSVNSSINSPSESKYLNAVEKYEAGDFATAVVMFQELGEYRDSESYIENISVMMPYQGTWEDGAKFLPKTIVISGWELLYINHHSSGDTEDSFDLSLNDDGSVNSSGSSALLPAVLLVDENGQLVYRAVQKNGTVSDGNVFDKKSDSTDHPELLVAPEIGMTEEQVIDSTWGYPEKKNKTTTVNGTGEQWVYSCGYIYFDNGIVEAIQETNSN